MMAYRTSLDLTANDSNTIFKALIVFYYLGKYV